MGQEAPALGSEAEGIPEDSPGSSIEAHFCQIAAVWPHGAPGKPSWADSTQRAWKECYRCGHLRDPAKPKSEGDKMDTWIPWKLPPTDFIFVPMPVAAVEGVRDCVLHMSSVRCTDSVAKRAPPRPATQRHLPQDPISEKSLSSGVKYLFLLVLFLITELVVFCGQEAIEDDCFLHWAASRRLLAKSLDPQGFVANPADASLLRDPWFYQICSFSWSMPF